jgi:hypothetical protein
MSDNRLLTYTALQFTGFIVVIQGVSWVRRKAVKLLNGRPWRGHHNLCVCRYSDSCRTLYGQVTWLTCLCVFRLMWASVCDGRQFRTRINGVYFVVRHDCFFFTYSAPFLRCFPFLSYTVYLFAVYVTTLLISDGCTASNCLIIHEWWRVKHLEFTRWIISRFISYRAVNTSSLL